MVACMCMIQSRGAESVRGAETVSKGKGVRPGLVWCLVQYLPR